MPEHPRGRDTTPALTEIRAVLGRARTALERLDDFDHFGYEEDPDRGEMETALDEVIELLNPWQRTGTTKKPTT